MPTPVRIIVEGLELTGELNDSEAGRALARRLPLAWSADRWGREYYGPLDKTVEPVSGPGKEEMAVGELAFHPPSGLLCLFFGRTPASRGEQPRAAFPVLSVGMLQGDWKALAALGDKVRAELEAL
jgi:hypothetical protein